MIILGIDTSCDDTSIAVVRDGNTVLSNVVSSQVDLHKAFWGVVPEIASRKHVELIDGIYREALSEAGIAGNEIGCIAATAGPGLIGSILVGLSFAKGLAMILDKPLVGVNHIEAHAMSIFIEREIEFPYLALVVSGGHTIILLMEEPCRFKVLGSTRDDAAGEAFDKIAKFLAIGYPGGKIVEEYAKNGRGDSVAFPRPMIDEVHYDFSFSGLKTSFINYVKKNNVNNQNISDILASFQEAAFDVLSAKTIRAALDCKVRTVVVGGGVASNGRLREVFRTKGRQKSIDVFFSSPSLCTDNGAMIAVTGYRYLEKGLVSPPDVQGYSRMVLR